MDRHLKTVHKMNPLDISYKKALAAAKNFDFSILDSSELSPTHKINQRYGTPLKFEQENISTSMHTPRKARTQLVFSTPPEVFPLSSHDSNDDLSHIDDSNDSDYQPSPKNENLSESIKTILDGFQKFLIGPDGEKTLSSAKQIRDDIQRMIVFCGLKESIAPLFDPKFFRDNYLVKIQEENSKKTITKASSIKKYLCSFTLFCDYILNESINIDNIQPSAILHMKLKNQSWKKVYAKKKKAQDWVKEMEEVMAIDTFVTPEHINKYFESEHSVMAKSLFEKFETSLSTSISQKDFCCMRDHLFSVIHFGNGHRSGVSANLMVEEFNAAKLVGDFYELYVCKHKTFNSHGPAVITLTPIEFKWMQIYVKKVRPLVETSVRNVFISFSGNEMDSGQISNRLNSLWVKSGIFEQDSITRQLSCNLIRKATATGIRNENLGHYKEVANLMGHELKTAESSYVVQKKQKSAAVAGQIVRQYNYSHNKLPTSPRHNWTSAEIKLISNVFNENILTNKISMEDVVKNKIENLPSYISCRQIYDKVRSLMRYSPLKKSSKVICFV
ncbi:uncharacterized protein LOC136094737 [Hydra vulgaris]|uniref:uncharacterized protein LOC136094737 n=1 Tax=Hydra vulgaris TaxID=6087 RepID=UPI0032EA7D67